MVLRHITSPNGLSYYGNILVFLLALRQGRRNPGESRKTLQYRKFHSLATPQHLGVAPLFTHDIGGGQDNSTKESNFMESGLSARKKSPESWG